MSVQPSEEYDWLLNYIDYEAVDRDWLRSYEYESVENMATEWGYRPIDVVCSIIFEDVNCSGDLKEGNETITWNHLQNPWRYKCILSNLLMHFTVSELSTRFPINEQTIIRHAKNQGVIGDKRVDWDVEDSWSKAQEKTITRDGECVICGMKNQEHKRKFDRSLTAHHVVPRRMFDEKRNADSLDNLVALCCKCHQSYEISPRELFLMITESKLHF